MGDRWEIRGFEYVNCNCNYGCPCQFNAPTTHGYCEAISGVQVVEGYFNETRLDGLRGAMILRWPGEIAEGNGRQQLIIDERADASQREAMRKIMLGESTKPGSTHFYVFHSTVTELLDTLYASIELSIDVAECAARLVVPGVIDSTGSPIVNPHSGDRHHAEIHLRDGFEYRRAWMGSGTSKVTGGISMELRDSYGQFNELNMNQDGVVG